jgi:hypothetical protein
VEWFPPRTSRGPKSVRTVGVRLIHSFSVKLLILSVAGAGSPHKLSLRTDVRLRNMVRLRFATCGLSRAVQRSSGIRIPTLGLLFRTCCNVRGSLYIFRPGSDTLTCSPLPRPMHESRSEILPAHGLYGFLCVRVCVRTVGRMRRIRVPGHLYLRVVGLSPGKGIAYHLSFLSLFRQVAIRDAAERSGAACWPCCA